MAVENRIQTLDSKIMIIILIISIIIINVLCFSFGFREGRWQRGEEIKQAYIDSPLATRDYLIGKTENLPHDPLDLEA